MARIKEVEVSILNWQKFNPRKDVKNSTWFRLEHTLFEHPDFLNFHPNELLFWIYLLSISSKKNLNTFVFFPRHAELVARLKYKYQFSGLEKLNKIKAIIYKDVTPTARGRDVDVTDASRARDAHVLYVTKRNVTKREEESIGPSNDDPDEKSLLIQSTNNPTEIQHSPTQSNSFDFERIYEMYPRRRGTQRKADGLKICKNKFNTPEGYEDLHKAVINYGAHCKLENKIGTEYVSQFRTFVSSIWEEWINPLPISPRGNGVHPVTKAQQIQNQNDDYFAKAFAKVTGADDGTKLGS